MRDEESIWPEWQIVEKLGEGSFGSVYKAKRNLGGTDLFSAIKIIKIPGNRSEINAMLADGYSNEDIIRYYQELVNNCLDEIKLSVVLKDIPNVVAVEDYQVVSDDEKLDWTIYIRMELLNSLIDYMKQQPLTEHDVIQLGIDICSALENCQKDQIIHRDIKPENIFISRHGNYKLGDFGIARQLDSRSSGLSTKGTFNYMAPEVYYGQQYDVSADTYSLALVLYKLVNNIQLPFVNELTEMPKHQAADAAVSKRLKGDPIPMPVDASADFGRLLLAALQHNPQDRLGSATLFKDELKALKDRKKIDPNETVAIRRPAKELPPDQIYQTQRSVQPQETLSFDTRKRTDQGVILAAILVTLAIGVSAFVLYLTFKDDSSDQKNDPEVATTEAVGEEPEKDQKTELSSDHEENSEVTADDLEMSLINQAYVDLSEYSRAAVITYGQSSAISQEGLNNTAAAALDGVDETSWQEGVEGDGIGEAMWFELDRDYPVEYLAFKLGNWRDDEYYFGNNRPSTLRIELNDFTAEIQFPDEMQIHYVKLSQPYQVNKVKITITGVYKGAEWMDTCIAEVGVYGK